VRDTGIGIPRDRQTHVFDAFTQADGSTTRRYGGTGLGLTISARLVETMGGRMSLESEPGQGSTFRFTIPVEVVPVPLATPTADASLPDGLRVLVVDDNATNRLILRAMLDRLPADVVTVDSGGEALDVLDRALASGQPFGLVLLDYHMPGMDGLQFLDEARRREIDVPSVLLLTSVDLPEIGIASRSLGVRSCLVKPVRRLDLINAMRAVLVEKADALPIAEVRPPARETPVAAGPRILLAEDNPVNQRMARYMLDKRGYQVDVVNDGREAVDAWTRGQYDLVLMDVQMPVMDGFGAVAAIRSAEAESGRHTPIIALTAGAFVEDRDRCLAAGMDAYVTKPFTAARLCEAIEQLLASSPRAA
jgi:two-component system sensor histidine kinase/response regulator